MKKESYFGSFGGQFVPELLMPPLLELEKAMEEIVYTERFKNTFQSYLREYAGRPTPLTYLKNLSQELGFHLWAKREDLLHSGAHKINNTLGQGLLAKEMGKKVLLAETGAGQHGVATATAAAVLGLKCLIYMGEVDMNRQKINVYKMRLLGAEVIPVKSSTRTLKDAINAALRHWISSQKDTHYCLGSVVGPHPYPKLVREFQSVIGKETKRQFLEKTGKLPDYIIACVGGGSNSIGIFSEFLEDDVKLIGVEAGGSGKEGDPHSATLTKGSVGILHGAKSYLLQTEDGQVLPSHSVAPGLDYPGVGPEHAYLKESGRVDYVTVYDHEAVSAFELLSKKEGIIPALESAHAIAYAVSLKGKIPKGSHVVVNLSGRGDKDLEIVREFKGEV